MCKKFWRKWGIFFSGSKLQYKTLQLVGVASMLIACKYEEMYVPEVNDFVFITDQAYEAKVCI